MRSDGRFYLVVILLLFVTLFLSCAIKQEEKNGTQGIYILVAGTDWSGPSSLMVIRLHRDDGQPYLEQLISADDAFRDPVVSTKDHSDDKTAYIVNRQYGSLVDQGSVTVLDRERLFAPQVTYPVHDATPSNPYDILVLNDNKAYVTRWAADYSDILIVDPGTGAGQGTIALSGLGTNPDGLPRPAWLYSRDDLVFVMLQNISSIFSYSPGRVAVIDTAADDVRTVIDLQATNPGDAAIRGNRMYIGCTGNYFDPSTSGLEVVDIKNMTSLGLTVSGADLGGFITHLALVDENRAFVVVYDGAWPETDKVVEINPSTGEIIDTWYQHTLLYAPGVAVTDRFLIIADNSASKVVFMSLSSRAVEDEIDMLLPPVSLAVYGQ